MKIGIYNSCRDNAATGGLSAAVLASALSRRHQTEIIRTQQSPTPESLALSGECSLAEVSFRVVDPQPQNFTDPNRPDRRYQAIWDWSNELTRPYDLFINFADRLPIFCASPRGVLVIQFPHDFVPLVYQRLWRAHLDSYQLKLANSYYTRFWTSLFWELDCGVLYPPAPILNSQLAKDNLIVSAGPFNATQTHNQLKLISAFDDLRTYLPSWSLSMMGEVDEKTSSRRSFARLAESANDAGVSVFANPTSEQQLSLFSRAKLLWQATGLGEDLERAPERAEPFSMRLLQAMSAGCVPLAANCGGLPEVIRHDKNGFFWNDFAELTNYTRSLANDERKRLQLAKAARRRAWEFRPERYVSIFLRQLESAFGIRTYSRANPVWLWRRLVSSPSISAKT